VSAGWRAQAAFLGRIPPAQPLLAPVAMVLAGLIAAGAGAALIRSGFIATAGLVAAFLGAFVRTALRREVSPKPSGRASVRLGEQPLPLLPVTPARRFWGEFAANLGASAGWVALGLVLSMVILLGNGLGIAASVPVALGTWVLGSRPATGPRGWVGSADGLGVLLALVPATLAGVSPSEVPMFAMLAAINVLLWLAPGFFGRGLLAANRTPTKAAKGWGAKSTQRLLERSARLDVRADESAEARLRRLLLPEFGRQALVYLGWAGAYACAKVLTRDSPLWHVPIDTAFASTLGMAVPNAALEFAHFTLGTAASKSRPGLGPGFLLPIDHRSRLRITARFTLTLGLLVPMIGLPALVLMSGMNAASAVNMAFWLTLPFSTVDGVRRGELDTSPISTPAGLAALVGVCLLMMGIAFPSPLSLFFGAVLTFFVWLPTVVHTIRLALP
jgi:hypothetical protein